MLIAKFDYESARARAYTVINNETKKVHSVIYRTDKNIWTCDCKWNTLKETFCSHIKEAMLFEKRKKAQILAKKLGIK